MGSNVRSFNLAIDKQVSAVPKRVEALHKFTAMEALRRVVLMSPVDTGRFKGNWQASVDTPKTGELDVSWPKESASASAARYAMDNGVRVNATIRPYSTSWLVNNLPYAVQLERGTSTQAPHGVLAVTVNGLRAWLQRQK